MNKNQKGCFNLPPLKHTKIKNSFHQNFLLRATTREFSNYTTRTTSGKTTKESYLINMKAIVTMTLN